MAKLNALMISLWTLAVTGVAHAAEIPDAPLPEPNYVGIVLFLALFFGLGIWFMWKIMRNKGDEKK